MLYIKGFLHLESWPEREHFSKKFPIGTLFKSEQTSAELKLYCWDSWDAQPVFEITEEDNASNYSGDVTLVSTNDAELSMTVNNLTDITEKISKISETRNIDEVIKSTNGFICLE
jgi:hypothetical protein